MEEKRINSCAAIDTGLGLFKGHRDQGMEKSRTPYIKENSIIKIGIDLSFFVALWLTLLCVLPRNALFFHISQRQTTTPKLAFTIATTAIVLVLFRLLLKNYGKTWLRTRPVDLIALFVSDPAAGIACYVILRKVIHAQYPFLFFVALFSLNCILSLFIRLLYIGLVDVFDITDI